LYHLVIQEFFVGGISLMINWIELINSSLISIFAGLPNISALDEYVKQKKKGSNKI